MKIKKLKKHNEYFWPEVGSDAVKLPNGNSLTSTITNMQTDISNMPAAVDMSNYYNKTEVDNKIEQAVFDPSSISLDGKEDVTNKITSITASSTDTQYPSAKAVYDYIEGLENIIGDVDSVLDNINNPEPESLPLL